MTTATQVKETGLLFKPEMIRALLAGTKTETRRLVKLPKWSTQKWEDVEFYDGELETICENTGCIATIKSPYGKPGDKIYAKESYVPSHPYDNEDESHPCYRADWNEEEQKIMGNQVFRSFGWKSPLFMPKWAARIWLEVTGIRVEQLQDIDQEGAKAEGVKPLTLADGGFVPLSGHDHVGAYRNLWEEINGKGSWSKNPWVWVIQFKRVERAQQ